MRPWREEAVVEEACRRSRCWRTAPEAPPESAIRRGGAVAEAEETGEVEEAERP